MKFNVMTSEVNPLFGLISEVTPFIHKKYLVLCLSLEKVSILLISPNNLNRYFTEKSAELSPYALFLFKIDEI